MKKDIQNRKDIEHLVDSFYAKVQQDALLGPYFIDKAKVNFEKHLPIMYDFWENILFFTGSYEGNPMQVHRGMHQVHPLSMKHFQQWMQLFTGTVDELFKGKNADFVKERALSISTIIQIKLFK
jgi:hemoglobin